MPVVDLRPKVSNIYIDDVRDPIEALVPYVFDNHVAGENPPMILHEVLEKRIFLGGEFNPLAVALYLLREPVQFQLPHNQSWSG